MGNRAGRGTRRNGMMLRKATIRLAALFVLLASAGDYWAYDRVDATAPMNLPAGEGLSYEFQHSVLTAFHQIDSPDDHCLWCSPWFAVLPPVLPRVRSSVFVLDSGPLFIPSRDLGDIEQPPKISSSRSLVAASA